MLELIAKAAALLALMLGVLYLTLRAKRFEFDKFRSVHTRRKFRVPIEKPSSEADSRPPPEPPPQ